MIFRTDDPLQQTMKAKSNFEMPMDCTGSPYTKSGFVIVNKTTVGENITVIFSNNTTAETTVKHYNPLTEEISI